jgi:hypothetical protein
MGSLEELADGGAVAGDQAVDEPTLVGRIVLASRPLPLPRIVP